MEIINIVKQLRHNYKACIRVTLHTEIINGRSWYVAKCIDNGIGWSLDDMPTKNWLRLQRSRALIERLGGTVEYHSIPKKGSVTVIKVPTDVLPLDQFKQILEMSAQRAAEKFESLPSDSD